MSLKRRAYLSLEDLKRENQACRSASPRKRAIGWKEALTWFIATTALSLSERAASFPADAWNAPSVGAKTVMPLLIPWTSDERANGTDESASISNGPAKQQRGACTDLELLEVAKALEEGHERREVGRNSRVLCRRDQVLGERLTESRRGGENLASSRKESASPIPPTRITPGRTAHTLSIGTTLTPYIPPSVRALAL